MNFIDKFLNSITMYQLVCTACRSLHLLRWYLGFVGAIPYSGLSLVISLAVIWQAATFSIMRLRGFSKRRQMSIRFG